MSFFAHKLGNRFRQYNITCNYCDFENNVGAEHCGNCNRWLGHLLPEEELQIPLLTSGCIVALTLLAAVLPLLFSKTPGEDSTLVPTFVMAITLLIIFICAPPLYVHLNLLACHRKQDAKEKARELQQQLEKERAEADRLAKNRKKNKRKY